MRIWIATLAILSVAGFVRADELNDSYAELKAAEAKKDPDAVMKLSADVSKLARAEEALPKPTEASAVDAWKQRQEYGKQVDLFSEYALSTTAIASTDAGKTVALVDQLIHQNPKSQYLGSCARAYIEALGKERPKQKLEGAKAILAASPNNEDALYALAAGYQSSNATAEQAGAYAMRLVNSLKSKAKPEGVSEADWERSKNSMLGQGYYIAGATACVRSTWTDCDRDLRAALPFLGKEYAVLGPAYFYLGLSNYQLGKLTGDRSKIMEGQKYSEQSAAIAGPMQTQAARNVAAIKQELAAPVRR
jgi:hypothetical protein